nr:hybrid sensor histidine kinase/response regulator [uncultured Aquabacterium sp.]
MATLSASLPDSLLRHWRRIGTLLLLFALTLWGWSLRPAPPVDDPGVRWLEHQRLSHRDMSGRHVEQEAAIVALPDSWKPAGLSPEGIGRYRSTFSVSPEAALDNQRQIWALRIDHLCHVNQMWLNGTLLHSTLPRPGWLGAPLAALIDIPVNRLQAGDNALDIELHCASQGGLSQPTLASKAALTHDFNRHQTLTRDLLLVLNLICLTFSLFVVMLWWLRRQEAAVGLFGVLTLVAAVRNCRYFVVDDLQLSPGLDSWLYFTAHVITACVQGWFVMALVERPWRAFNRLLWAVLIGFPLLGIAFLPVDPGLRATRDTLQAVLILTLLPSLWLLLRHSQGIPRNSLLGLGLGWLLILTASCHDLVVGRIIADVTFSHWVIWAIPCGLPTFSLMVIDRIVYAFNEIEQSNQQLESKVAERTRELAAANAAKSHFLASASHDLRQPVAAIGLITDLLRSKLADPALRSLTDRLLRAVNSMESLLKGLLDLSRLDSGTVEVQPRRIRLQPVLDAIVAHEEEAARHKGLKLTVRPTHAVVRTDAVLLEQILRNLVGNAIRHTREGGVLVGARARGSRWEVQVWDSGPGIEAHDLPRIFEAFVQLGNPGRERSQGLGLGLAIVQRAAQLQGHPLRVRSRVNRGSCFSVTLPAAEAPVTVRKEAVATDPDGALAGRKVLVVEDDATLREALVQWLQSWGMEVESGDSVAWVRSLPDKPWDLLLSDHRLADGTGRDVVQHLRRHQPDLRSLIITGDTSPDQLAELARSGLPVLHKPFRSEKLRAMVESAMARADRDDSV